MLSLAGINAVKSVMNVIIGTNDFSSLWFSEFAASFEVTEMRILMLHITNAVHTKTTMGSSLCRKAPDLIILVI